MDKKQIEDVLGPELRRSRTLLDTSSKRMTEVNLAMQALAEHLNTDKIYIFAAQQIQAKVFSIALKKKFVWLNAENCRGLEIPDVVILEGTLKTNLDKQNRNLLYGYLRDTRFWHIYDW